MKKMVYGACKQYTTPTKKSLSILKCGSPKKKKTKKEGNARQRRAGKCELFNGYFHIILLFFLHYFLSAATTEIFGTNQNKIKVGTFKKNCHFLFFNYLSSIISIFFFVFLFFTVLLDKTKQNQSNSHVLITFFFQSLAINYIN